MHCIYYPVFDFNMLYILFNLQLRGGVWFFPHVWEICVPSPCSYVHLQSVLGDQLLKSRKTKVSNKRFPVCKVILNYSCLLQLYINKIIQTKNTNNIYCERLLLQIRTPWNCVGDQFSGTTHWLFPYIKNPSSEADKHNATIPQSSCSSCSPRLLIAVYKAEA